MTLIFAVESLAGWVRIDAVAYTRAPGETFRGAFWRMAGVFACVGFYEELVSRGYLLRTMAQGFAGRRVRREARARHRRRRLLAPLRASATPTTRTPAS